MKMNLQATGQSTVQSGNYSDFHKKNWHWWFAQRIYEKISFKNLTQFRWLFQNIFCLDLWTLSWYRTIQANTMHTYARSSLAAAFSTAYGFFGNLFCGSGWLRTIRAFMNQSYLLEFGFRIHMDLWAISMLINYMM
jgi:hypothetical protein